MPARSGVDPLGCETDIDMTASRLSLSSQAISNMNHHEVTPPPPASDAAVADTVHLRAVDATPTFLDHPDRRCRSWLRNRRLLWLVLGVVAHDCISIATMFPTTVVTIHAP